MTKEFVELLHKHRRIANVRTVDTLPEAERLAECGVDMIPVNILE